MKTAVIHGQAHKGNTYQVTRLLIEQLGCRKDEVKEFQVNGLKPCIGCFNCIIKDETLCPHREQTAPMIEAMDEADVIIFESPNYCMGMTGQMKTLFDHLGYRWMSHRPNGSMKHKIGVAIATTAGMGASGTTKAIRKQFFWWGMGKTFRISESVFAMSWEQVEEKKKRKIEKHIKKAADRIKGSVGKVRPGLKTRLLFRIFKIQQGRMSWNFVDTEYWRKQGWIK